MLPHSVTILTDNCVPDDVGGYLVRRGYDVRLVREVLRLDVKDPVIVTAAIELGAVVVTFDKDFRSYAQRAVATPNPKRRTWGLILLDCPKAEGVSVLNLWINAIELELAECRLLNPDILLIRAEFSDIRALFHRRVIHNYAEG